MDDYKRILESSNTDFAAHMKAMEEYVDPDLFKIACRTVAMEQYRQGLGDTVTQTSSVTF